MLQFEKAWFGQTPSCPELTSSVSSNSIGLNSFWGLFLIAGVASCVALTTCITMFLYENRDILINLNPSSSIWGKIKAMATRFEDKDLRSHTFRNSDLSSNRPMHPHILFEYELANINHEQTRCHAPWPAPRAWRSFHMSSPKAQSVNWTLSRIILEASLSLTCKAPAHQLHTKCSCNRELGCTLSYINICKKR